MCQTDSARTVITSRNHAMFHTLCHQFAPARTKNHLNWRVHWHPARHLRFTQPHTWPRVVCFSPQLGTTTSSAHHVGHECAGCVIIVLMACARDSTVRSFGNSHNVRTFEWRESTQMYTAEFQQSDSKRRKSLYNWIEYTILWSCSEWMLLAFPT